MRATRRPARDDGSVSIDGMSSLDGIVSAGGDEPTTPLLPPASADGDADGDSDGTISYYQHLTDVVKLTYPIITAEFFQNTLVMMDIVFVGQLGKNELGACALASVWFNLWNCFMIGAMTAVDTILSNLFGADKFEEYGIWTGNSLIIVFMFTLVMAGLMASCGPCMHLLGQEAHIADEAGKFAMRLIPGLFPYYSFKVLTKYLQTQHILAQGVVIGFLANVCNGLFNWALIFKAGWGIAGSPWATTFTRALEFLVIVVYILIRRRRLRDTWPRFSASYLSSAVLQPFWDLALPGAVSIAAMSWAFEVLTVLAGLLGTVPLAAHIIMMGIDGLVFQSFSFAVGVATSIQIGKLMGEQKHIEAQRSSHMFYFVSCSGQLLLILILMLCREELASALSADAEVADVVTRLIPIMCVFMIGDTLQCTNGGVFRGLGRQRTAFILNLFSLVLLNLGVGSLLAFLPAINLGIYGLWWGLVAGVSVTAVIGLYIIGFQIVWKDECRAALHRINSISTGLASASGHRSEHSLSSHSEDETELEDGNTVDAAHMRLPLLD